MSSLIWRGEEYRCYAPGHGALEFTHVSMGRATADDVPMAVMKRLIPPGWELTRHNGVWEAYRPVRRMGKDRLEMSFNDEPALIYRYEISWIPQTYRFECLIDGNWEPVRNESRIGSLTWWLANESLLALPGKTQNEKEKI